MAKFLENTASVKKDAGRTKKKKKETTQQNTTQSPSVSNTPSRQEQAQYQRTYGRPMSSGSDNTGSERQQRQTQVPETTRQKTLDRLEAKYGQNRVQRDEPSRRETSQLSQKAQGINARLTEKYGTGVVRGGKHTYMDDVAKTMESTLRQTAAEERRFVNTAFQGLTQKDAHLYTKPEEVEKAKAKSEKLDEDLRKKIKQETAEMEKLKEGHSYLGKQGLSAVNSTVGMATDAAWGPASLLHMFMRTQAGSQGNVKDKVEPLKQKLSASGNYTQEEIDEMFKNVDKWDYANSIFDAGIEVLSERMFTGIGLGKKVGGVGLLDKTMDKLWARMGSKTTTGLLGKIARGTAEEVAEEEVGNPLQTLASNLIYGNRLQAINEDATRRSLQAQSDAIRSRIQNPQDAQAIAAQLNSPSFFDESKNVYLESGASDKDAEKLAELTRDYLEASATGDLDRAEELQNEMVSLLADEDSSGYKEKWTLQDAIDVAVSTSMMTTATGGPAAMINSRIGSSYRDTNGMDAVNNLAKITKNLDPDRSARAQAIMDRIDAGESISGTQVYDLIQWSSAAATEVYRREDVKERMASDVMRNENLQVAPAVRNDDGTVTLGEETERRYEERFDTTLKRVKNLQKIGRFKDVSQEDVEVAADVSTAYLMGTITANQINELSIDNAAVRSIFETITGIDLNQFNEYDKNGDLKIAESNIEMQKALFAKAADNYIQSARYEQEAWNDGARGEVATAVTSRIGSNGDVAVHDALNAVDPRDKSTFILMGRAVENVYDYSRHSEDSWDAVKGKLKKMYPSLPSEALRGVYESAKQDKAIAENPYYNAIVSSGNAMNDMNMSEAEQAEYGKFTNEAQRILKDSEQIVLQSLAKQFNINIKLLPSKEFRLKSQDNEEGKNKYSNGFYDPKTGTMFLNGGNDMERNLVAVALHEITHHIAVFAPDEYLALSNRVMDRWYKNDAEAFKAAIQRKQESYKKVVKQELSEEQALEEVIADAVGEMSADQEFVEQICREEPSLAHRILNAIRDVLRRLRQILSSNRVSEEYEDAFFSQLDMWSEAERLWLNAARAAQKNRADMAIEDLQNRIYEDLARKQEIGTARFSISDEDYMAAVNSGDMEEAQRMVDQVAREAGYVEAVYHGTGEYFTVFRLGDEGIHLGNEQQASQVAKQRYEKFSRRSLYKLSELADNIDRLDDDTINEILSETERKNLPVYNGDVSDRQQLAQHLRQVGQEHERTRYYEPNISLPTFDRETGEHVMKLYSKIQKPLVLNGDMGYWSTDNIAKMILSKSKGKTKMDGVDISGSTIAVMKRSKSWETLEKIQARKIKGDAAWDALARVMEQEGYDGIKYLNQYEGDKNSYSYIALRQSDIKSADPVTYDADGDVIPLSQRFDKEDNDIRYSISEEDREELNSDGVDITESGSAVRYSYNSWMDTDIDALKDKLRKAGFDNARITKWINDVNSISALIAGDMTRLNYEADQYQDALKPNAEYYYTLDLSTLCQKRRLYQGTYNKIMHHLINNVLLPEDTIRLRQMMDEMGHQVPCGICYEESRKKNEGKFAERWLNGYGKRWKGYKNQEHTDPYIPSLNEVTTTDGRAKLREEHPEAYESYVNYQKTRGSANPKISYTHTDYRGDILRMTESEIKNVKHIGGLRIQSFSDFEIPHVIDMMQAVLDMSAMNLTAQAYTKVPAFADIFGGTGIKINLSLIGRLNPETGELEFDAKEGIDPAEAFRIREKYSHNVGTILVGADDASILAAWADPRVDMVIPFHRSGWGKKEFEKLGLSGYKDFTKGQTERYMMGKKDMALSTASKALGLTGADKLQGIYAEDYWDYNKTGKENAEAYLKLCAEKHYRPVFYQFLHDNGDGTWSLQEDGSTDGYWKSLVDFKMYDNDGVGAKQELVEPNFDMDAAKAVMDEYEGNADTLPVADDVVVKFLKEYKEKHPNAKFSLDPADVKYSIAADLDEPYMAAVNSGNMEEAQRLVDEAAKMAMPDTKLGGLWMHGTNNEFTEFNFSQGGKNGRAEGYGIYLTQNQEIAQSYGNRIIKGYVNITRPAFSDKKTIKKSELKKLIKTTIEDQAKRMVVEDSYADIASALRDTWISDYTYTYDKSIDASISAVADQLLRINDNDMDIIQEVMLDTGVRTYSDATNFYDTLTALIGFDGFSTVWDNVGTGEQNRITLAFRSNQIKSAEPVTYAEDGSVIPLSQRFDPTNNDIRYSLPTQDSDGNILSDGQMEYFKYSQARDEQGRLVPMYHVTPAGGFTIFESVFSFDETSFSFSNDLDFALNYSSEDGNPEDWQTAAKTRLGGEETEDDRLGHYKVYLDMQNPLVVTDEMFDEMSIYEWPAYAKREGYDGVIHRDFDGSGADIYQVFSSSRIKDTRNTDPTNNPDIRYSIDDENDVQSRIAYEDAEDNSFEALKYYEDLIEREPDFDVERNFAKAFDEERVSDFYAALTKNDGVLFSDPVLEEGRVRMAKSKEDFWKNINAKWNDRWTTSGEVLDIGSVRKDIRELVMGVMNNSSTTHKYKTDIVKKTLIDVRTAYQFMKQDRTDVASALLYHSALRMVENVDFINDDTFVEYKGLRDYLRTTRISLGEEYWSDVDFAAFRKANMGRMKLVKGDTNVDQIYQEMQELWPEWFHEDEEMTPPDQLEQISHVLDVIQPYKVAYSSEECASLAFDIADELYNIMEGGKEYQSLADKYKQKYDAKTKAMKTRHAEALLRCRKERYAAGVKAERAKWKAREERRKERTAHKAMFNHIMDDYNWLVQRVLDPTKDKNVPEEFRKSLAEFLQTLDLQTEASKKLEAKTGHVASKTFKMRELKDRLNALAESKGEDGVGMFEFDSYVPELLKSLTNKLEKNGNTIDALDASDIKQVEILMKAIRHNLSNLNKRIKAEKSEEISVKGADIVTDQLKRVEKRGQAKKYGGAKGSMDVINTASLTPAYFFERLGPGMQDMYDELRFDGFDTYIRNEQMITTRLTQILGKYYKTRALRKNKPTPGSTIEEWRDDRSAQTIELTNGTVTMTAAQMMSLYCLQKRTQALQHMVRGGIHVTPIQTGSRIQSIRDSIRGKVESAESVILTMEDINTIVSKLTPEQIQVADQLQQLMAVDMARLGNEAHRAMYGYEIFNDPDYFPIKSRSNEIATDINKIGDVVEKIKSFGPAKPLDPNARNIIEVDDIFSVTADHCNGMNLYNAYLVPISDFVRVYNYKHTLDNGRVLSVKDAIEMAHSDRALTYITNFLKDLNGIKPVQRGGLEDIMNKALGTAKKTAVFGNVRVALQQPTAIVRALAVMSPKHFVPLLKIAPQKGVRNEMYKYCPIAQWKSWGYYDTYMGRDIEDVMMNNWSMSDVALSGIYGELDNWTWSLIWRGVKSEMHEAHPEMDVKSEEFLQLCGRRASEVFDKTQVVDSTFHRSDAMRSKQVAVKTFTAFMAEPTLTLNVFRAGIDNAKEEWLDGNKSKAAATFNRALSVIVLQAAIVAAAQAFADAWRGKDPGWPGDDDDEDADYWVRWLHNYVANLFDQLHLENNIYLVKDVTPFINFMFSQAAEYYGWNPWLRAVMGWDQDFLYSNNNLVFAALENTATGVQQIYKKLQKGDDYSKDWYDIIQKTSSGIGTFTGIPIGTIMKDTKPIWEKIVGVTFAADGSVEEIPEKSVQFAGVEDGSTVDNVLNHFGLNLSPSEQRQRNEQKAAEARQKETDKIKGKVEGLSGEERDKKVWSAVTTYIKESNNGESYKDLVQSGGYDEIAKMKRMYVEAGGDEAYFEERIFSASKTALKKSIVYDPTPEQTEAQTRIKEYLTSHGMTDNEMSQIAYKSNTAKELKVAFRLNDKDAMLEELKPLVDAGLTYEDLEKLWKYRNRVDLKAYKSSGGKYADRLKSTGTYIWPISGRVYSEDQITSHYGYRNTGISGASNFHQAIDIGAPSGTPVVAADGGTVIFADWNGAGGKTVKIQHDDGTITYYQHLSWWDANVGDVVAQGQVIGNVGSTGVSSGPHLDIRFEVNGDLIDPLTYLAS